MSESALELVSLPKELTQPSLGELKSVVDKLLDEGKPIQLDAEPVERVDGAGLQFMIALATGQEAQKVPQPVVKNASELLETALDDFGTPEKVKNRLLGQSD